MSDETGKTLTQIRAELLATFSTADRTSYHHLVGWLRDNDIASSALKTGDAAPDFLLLDADGVRLGSSVAMLPIPATYVTDCGGRIRSAFVEPDFTVRQEPDEIVEALRLVIEHGEGSEPIKSSVVFRLDSRYR